MSQQPPKPPYQPYAQPPANNPYQTGIGPGMQAPPQNTQGVIGFVLSLLGFMTCPILSPIGLFVSWGALKREPKGMAVAGLIIGILGTISLIILVVVLCLIFAGMFAGIAAVGAIVQEVPQQQAVAKIVAEYEGSELPSTTEGQNIIQGETDFWGNQLRYVVDESGFRVVSDGPDKKPNTSDDLSDGPYFTMQEAEFSRGYLNYEDSDFGVEFGEEFNMESEDRSEPAVPNQNGKFKYE